MDNKSLGNFKSLIEANNSKILKEALIEEGASCSEHGYSTPSQELIISKDSELIKLKNKITNYTSHVQADIVIREDENTYTIIDNTTYGVQRRLHIKYC